MFPNIEMSKKLYSDQLKWLGLNTQPAKRIIISINLMKFLLFW